MLSILAWQSYNLQSDMHKFHVNTKEETGTEYNLPSASHIDKTSMACLILVFVQPVKQ